MSHVWRGVLPIALTMSSIGACGKPGRENPEPLASCVAPANAGTFDSSRVERLAGEYRLISISDSYPVPNATRDAELHLAVVRDTLRRFYRYSALAQKWRRWGERPLAGWLQGHLEELHATWSGNPRSEDPDAPGVYYEQGYGEFIIGHMPDLMDGASTSMRIRWIAENGFGGRWEPDLGLVMVVDSATGKRLVFGGEFCAWRL